MPNSNSNSKKSNLTKAQTTAVMHKDGPLLVIAGPGSGKTRVITSRIAKLISSGVRPYNICAITFTNKAAEEMRNRVNSMQVPHGTQISTFHSLCVRILRQYHNEAGIVPNFSIYDDADQRKCVKEAIKAADLDSKNFTPRKMLEAISRIKNNLQSVADFEADCGGDYFSKCLLKIYKNYQRQLEENNAMDFDDLLLKTAFLLRDNSSVRLQLNDRFHYLMVDEYQDTNHAQYQIACGLAREHGNICVTGDPDQSIYGWRGADIKNILAFEADWPNATVVKLEENFRSGPEILAGAEKLIAANKNRRIKNLIAAGRKDSQVKTNCLDDESEEAHYVASHVAELIKNGQNPNDIAVFYRVNSMSRSLEEAFIENRVNYQIVRGVEFYGRKEIKDMLAYLKILVNPADDVSLLRIINTPARGIGKTTIDRIAAFAKSYDIGIYEAISKIDSIDIISAGIKKKVSAFAATIEKIKRDLDVPVAQIMEEVFEQSGLYAYLKNETDSQGHSQASAIENVEELINAAARFDENSEENSIADYLQQIALFSDTDAYDPDSGRVSFMTLHAAKGLEFENVIIIGAEHGILPHERSFDDTDGMEEERRLFFVGMTRAKGNLLITHSKYRTIHGQTKRSIPSQFLYESGIESEPIHDEPDFTPVGFTKPSFRYDNDYSQVEHYVSPPAPPKKTKASTSGKPFCPGQMVVHKKFGTGRVKDFRDMGPASAVVVDFNNGQTKTLMLKYANLEIIG